MTTLKEMLKKRPIDPQILEKKVKKMQDEARAYQEGQEALDAEMAAEFNTEEQALRAARRRRLPSHHTEP